MVEEMPRLAAEEAMMQVSVYQVGAGVAKPEHARRTYGHWRRTAQRGAARAPVDAAQWRASVAAAGIAIVEHADG